MTGSCRNPASHAWSGDKDVGTNRCVISGSGSRLPSLGSMKICAAGFVRQLNTMALTGLIGRGAMGWDGLLSEVRYGTAQARLSGDVA